MLKLRKQTLRAPSSFYTRMQSQFHLWIAALTSVGRPLFGASTAEPSRKGRGSSCRAVLSPPPPRTAIPPRPAPLQPRMGAHRTVTAPGAGPPAAPPGAGSRGGSARSLRPEAGGVQTAAPHRARLAAPGRPHPRAGTARGAGGAGVVTRGRGKWGREKTGSRGTGAAGLGPPPGPALRRAGAAPAGRPRSRPTPPPFFPHHRGWDAVAASCPDPPRAGPARTSFLTPPARHTPPRARSAAATLPAPLTDFMAEAMSSYLSACSARRARCSSCSRSPMAASVVAAGLGTEPLRRWGEGRGSAPQDARAVRGYERAWRAQRSRRLPPAHRATVRLAAPHAPGDGWRLALRGCSRALAASPRRRVQLAPLRPARSLALLPPAAPAR